MSTGSDKETGSSGPATPTTPTRHPKPRLLTISSDTTYISLSASASASSGVSGNSATRSESSDATSTGIRSTYDMFVQQQGSSFARDIEALIHAEEESRATRHTAPREELHAGIPICDQFLVLGAEQHRAPPLAMITFRSGIDPSPEHSDSAIYHPKVLFRYPPSSGDNDVAGLTYFCFPEGAVPQKFIRKKDAKDRKTSRFSFKLLPTTVSQVQAPQNQSQLVLSRESQELNVDYIVGPEPEQFRFTPVSRRHRPSLLGGGGGGGGLGRGSDRNGSKGSIGKRLITNHYDPESSFVFLISGSGGTDMRYGICVYKETVAYQTDQFYCVEPLCYCLITSVPFLLFDINALISILDFPRISEALTLPQEKMAAFIAEAEAALDAANETKDSNEDTKGEEGEVKKEDDKKDIKEEVKKDPMTVAYKRAIKGVVEYMRLRVPEAKQPLRYFPETRKVPFEMTRPICEEESQLLEEFGGSILFHILPVKTVLQLLCAFLLEYKVVVVSPNKRLLSAVVISLLPLIRPFAYPSSVIPVLPLSLLTYLEAPVPLLVGLTRQPHAESTEGFFIVNLHTASVQCTKPLPPLPRQQKLEMRLTETMRKLNMVQPPARGIGPEIPAKLFSGVTVSEEADAISGIFQSYFIELFGDFQLHCITSISPDAKATSIFLGENFVEFQEKEDRAFMNLFLKTQVFRLYEDKKLREIDRDKTAERKKIHSPHKHSKEKKDKKDKKEKKEKKKRKSLKESLVVPTPITPSTPSTTTTTTTTLSTIATPVSPPLQSQSSQSQPSLTALSSLPSQAPLNDNNNACRSSSPIIPVTTSPPPLPPSPLAHGVPSPKTQLMTSSGTGATGGTGATSPSSSMTPVIQHVPISPLSSHCQPVTEIEIDN